MRIAVTYDNGEIYQRFGHTPQFKFYDVDRNRIYLEQIVATPPKKGHAAIAAFLKKMAVDVVICDRIGDGGEAALKAADIELYAGIQGNADKAVRALIAGKLPKETIPKSKDKRHCSDPVGITHPLSFY